MQAATAPIQPAGFTSAIRTRLEGLGSADMWRTVLAFLSGLLTFLATTGGLFILIPWVQSAIIAGIAVGLTSPKIRVSALVGVLVGLLGAMFGPENFYNSLFNFTASPPSASLDVVLGAALLCGAVSAGVTLIRGRFEGSAVALVALAILMLIANLWFTPITLNEVSSMRAGNVPLNAFNDQLDGYIDEELVETDGALFLFVIMEMERGRGFYDAYSTALTNIRGGTQSVADYRTPLVFWLWDALPSRQAIVIAWLVLCTMTILAVVPLVIGTMKAPLVIPGVAALTSYLAYFALNLELLRQDPWAAALALLAFAAFGISIRSARWRAWTLTAVALAVLAFLTREIMAFPLIAGFASAFFGDRAQRKFRLTAWISGGLAFGILYGIHAMTAAPYINLVSADIPRVGYGNLPFMLAAFDFATSFLGRHGWLPMLLGCIGVVATLMIRDSRLRTFAILATLGPLAAFLIIGNNAYVIVPGVEKTMVNYWGVAVVPLLYAALPFAFSVLPHSLREVPLETVADDADAEPESSEQPPSEGPERDQASES